jgi:hypothetical protein
MLSTARWSALKEGVELAALERLREAPKMIGIEIRIRPRARITPGCGVDADRSHESTQAQFTRASHILSLVHRATRESPFRKSTAWITRKTSKLTEQVHHDEV